MQHCNLLGVFFWPSPQKNVQFLDLHCCKSKNCAILYFWDVFFLAFTPKKCSIFELAHHKSKKMYIYIQHYYFRFHHQTMLEFWTCTIARPKIVQYYHFWGCIFLAFCKCLIWLSTTIIHTWSIHTFLHF
jgi:hypothetical protein